MANRKKQFKLPNRSQKTARMLIDQQMWCWGCDVRRAEGDLLLQYGAVKRPSPNPRYHGAYCYRLEGDAIINLWGWGLWIACPQRGSLLLSRSRFKIQYTSEFIPMPEAWCKRDLPPTKPNIDDSEFVHVHHLLTTALHWVGTYETWLNSQVAPDYREHVLTKWPQRKRYKGGIPATEMADSWFDLSNRMLN